ncbi:MAG TPA: MBL fold metallo-hydrolase [Candidatus Limnocylindrales bacterium]|nr:MBL fold metallo-hydrolase [Candidatus Limnocylindrales bacterium]
MELLHRVVGPISTNVWVLGDEASREAIAVDTATPSAAWIGELLAERGWTLKLIVSTHRHWDHIGDNAAVQAATGAQIAVHPLDREGLERPEPLWAPFPIPPSVPAVEVAEGGEIRFGGIRLEVLHTPGHTEGSVCLLARAEGLLLTGDTLFAGGWGRTDLPGGSAEAMVDSIARLARLDDALAALPGHGPRTTIGRERAWLELVARERRLPF